MQALPRKRQPEWPLARRAWAWVWLQQVLLGNVLRTACAVLHLEVLVHYPDVDSAVEFCGFRFQVQAQLKGWPASSTGLAHRVGPNLFLAKLQLSELLMGRRPSLAVFADQTVSSGAADGSASEQLQSKCERVCPHLEPGLLGQLGPYELAPTLSHHTLAELWPHFCRTSWASDNLTLPSAALGGRLMTYMSRVPAAVLENQLPRPSWATPPILFRFNAEWFWSDRNAPDFSTWHDLMLAGHMEPFVLVEVTVVGLTSASWSNVPILSLKPPQLFCGACEKELRFICESWEESGFFVYWGGDHTFGRAAAFFEELIDQVLPHILARALPPLTDAQREATEEPVPVKALPSFQSQASSGASGSSWHEQGARAGLAAHNSPQLKTTTHNAGHPRIGVWGYCIGGLAAWNAITTKPGRFSMAYLGSPAMDFNCGEPFKQLHNISLGPTRPKIYIDSGAAESALMGRQTLLLFQRLRSLGLVEGEDLFYSRVEFGTHENRMLWRRSLQGLMALFGRDSTVRYLPVLEQSTISQGDNELTHQFENPLWNRVVALLSSGGLKSALWAFAAIAAAFLAGRVSVRARARRPDVEERPLVSSDGEEGQEESLPLAPPP